MNNKIREFLFSNQNTRQTVVKNAFWLIIGQLGSRLFRAAIIIYAARVLGTAGYGIFAYVIGLAGFFVVFTDFGVSAILTREVSRKPKQADNYFATAFWIKTVLMLLTAMFVAFILPRFPNIEAVKSLIPLIVFLITFDSLREFIASFFRGKEKMEMEALLITVTNITITLFGFVILYFVATPKALIITYALSAGTGTLLGIILLRKLFTKVFTFFRKELVIPILKAALPIMLLVFLGAFMFNIDIIMLGFFKTVEEVGLYSASQRIVQVLYMLPAILATVLFPVLSRFIGQQKHEKVKIIMERGMSAVFLIVFPIAIGGIILSKDILQLLYGGEYIPAMLAFQILILTPLIVSPGSLLSNYVFAYDKQKLLAPYVGIAAFSNVLLNILLIPLYGIVGAAVATIGANIIHGGLVWRLAKKINNFSTFRHLKKILLAAGLMGFLTFVLKVLGIHVLVIIAISAMFYFFVLYFLKEPTLIELKDIVPKRLS